MKRKLQDKAKRLAQNPILRQSVRQMKPQKSFWGLLGIIFFFFLPEIVAFVWGARITVWARHHAAFASSGAEELLYRGLVLMFEDGGSWVNLAIGFAFVIWWAY